MRQNARQRRGQVDHGLELLRSTIATFPGTPAAGEELRPSTRVSGPLEGLSCEVLPPVDIRPVERRLVDLSCHKFVIAVMELD